MLSNLQSNYVNCFIELGLVFLGHYDTQHNDVQHNDTALRGSILQSA
jgi:hypothetical protein